MKPYTHLMLLFVCIASIHISNAQNITLDSVKTKYESKTIHQLDEQYVKGYQTFFSKKELYKELSISPEALPLVQSAQKKS